MCARRAGRSQAARTMRAAARKTADGDVGRWCWRSGEEEDLLRIVKLNPRWELLSYLGVRRCRAQVTEDRSRVNDFCGGKKTNTLNVVLPLFRSFLR